MAFNEETTAKRMPPLNTSATTRALSAADRCLLFRFVSLTLEGDLPLSDELKLQQITGSFLRDHFRGGSL